MEYDLDRFYLVPNILNMLQCHLWILVLYSFYYHFEIYSLVPHIPLLLWLLFTVIINPIIIIIIIIIVIIVIIVTILLHSNIIDLCQCP